jgi:hypothetical protein
MVMGLAETVMSRRRWRRCPAKTVRRWLWPTHPLDKLRILRCVAASQSQINRKRALTEHPFILSMMRPGRAADHEPNRMAWLVVAGVVLWGTFPVVYATLFSAFYLPLLLMLAGLILRGVAHDQGRSWAPAEALFAPKRRRRTNRVRSRLAGGGKQIRNAGPTSTETLFGIAFL